MNKIIRVGFNAILCVDLCSEIEWDAKTKKLAQLGPVFLNPWGPGTVFFRGPVPILKLANIKYLRAVIGLVWICDYADIENLLLLRN